MASLYVLIIFLPVSVSPLMFDFVLGLPFSNSKIAFLPFRFASFLKSSEDIEAIISLNSFGTPIPIILCCSPSNTLNALAMSFFSFGLLNAASIDSKGFVASKAPSRTFLILIARESRKSRGSDFAPPPSGGKSPPGFDESPAEYAGFSFTTASSVPDISLSCSILSLRRFL